MQGMESNTAAFHEAAAAPCLNKEAAIALHTRMTETGSTSYDFGLFYESMLVAGVWASGAEMARDVKIQASRVYVKCRLTVVPQALADFFGRARITGSLAETVDFALRYCGHSGPSRLLERAALMPPNATFDEKVRAVLSVVEDAPPPNAPRFELVKEFGLAHLRRSSIAHHKTMKHGNHEIAEFALFYTTCLKERIWANVGSMARAFGMPAPLMRQVLTLADHPEGNL